ncbi:MAG: hypothetical protein H0W12_05795 [Chitinophagaceae bacterium]|nr:hypothetical protein [Chitinophagaceae bacterium]
MKKSLAFLILSVFLMLIIASCNKKDSNTPAATAASIQHKWTFLNAAVNQYYSGANHNVVVTGNSGDYMDFRAGGNLYVRILSSQDTSSYSLIGTDKVVFDGTDTFTIQTLTNTTLKLYNKSVTSATEYDEATYNLSR